MTEPYEVETTPDAPPLPGVVLVRPSVDDAIAAAAADLMMQAFACTRAFGDFHMAIGASAHREELVVRLMTDPNYRSFPWDRTHVWTTGEPRVAPEDQAHSMSGLGEMLLQGSDLPTDQAHHLPAHLPDAEERYHQLLCSHLESREMGHDRFDSVILSADSDELSEVEDPIGRLYSSSDDGQRVSITSRAIQGSRLVMVLAPGAGSKPVIDRYAQDHRRLGVIPLGGQLRWYLDRQACGHENLE
ncbi:MAG: 6-phosphogluconolactonase [Phycisphaerales bacterium]